MMKRTHFVFGGLTLVGLTIGCLLADRAFADTTLPGTCGTPHFSTDPRFNCPHTKTCYGGSGTCTDGTGYFPFVEEVAGQYADCTYETTSGNTCLIPAAPVCTSTGWTDINAFGQCSGTKLCTSSVTQPGCKPLATQP